MIFRRRRRGDRAAFVYHPHYATAPVPHAMDAGRGGRILADLEAARLLRESDVLRPFPAPMRSLMDAHDDGYLRRLEDSGAVTAALGEAVSPAEADAWIELQRRMVGGTRVAAAWAGRRGGCVVHLGGGLHHARRDRGQGFCLFNDVAVAVRRMRRRGFAGPVLVVDLDLHDGEGTRDCFRGDDSVHTYSVHNRDLDAEPARESTSIALGTGFGDAAYLDAVERTLPPLFERFAPEFVFYVAGVDAALDDALGDAAVTADGMLARDRRVFELVERHGSPPVVVTLAGGYGPRAWTYTARWLRDRLGGTGTALEPGARPPDAKTLRRLQRRVSPRELTRDRRHAPYEWSLDERDVAEALGGTAPAPRFLGYYSPYGLEIAFERHGLFPALRERGYPSPRLRLDLSDPFVHTLRVDAPAVSPEPLIEMQLSRQPGRGGRPAALRIEWLLLQRPDAEFSAERPALPGQSHPGLGILKRIVRALELIGLRLDLPCLEFVPSHWHVAEIASRFLAFEDPEVEALRRSLSRIAAREGFATVAWALERGEIVDRDGRPVVWSGAPMRLIVGGGPPRSRAQERAVERALASRRDRIVEADRPA